MKIVVIGGSGLIGSKLVKKLREDGHEPLPASPNSGVDTLTGEGLAEALEGAQVVVDVANAPDWEDAAVLHFFQTSSRNIVAAEAAARVGHHVALSVIGADRLPDSGYLRAKVAQEDVVKAATVPYTILRATQFFEFIGRVADSSAEGNTVRLPPALIQPVAADDVAAALADVATNAPVNGTVELAGPEPLRLDELARRVLGANDDARQVIADVHARYFGAELDDHSLAPGDNPRIGPTHFEDWLSHSAAKQTNPTNHRPRSDAWKTALTVLQEARPDPLRRLAHSPSVRRMTCSQADAEDLLQHDDACVCRIPDVSAGYEPQGGTVPDLEQPVYQHPPHEAAAAAWPSDCASRRRNDRCRRPSSRSR